MSTAAALTARDFRCVARGGFGDPYNAYAHTMAWFDGALYVGTTRANLHLRRANDPPGLRPWPVRCPADVYDLDLRAQIWRYDPGPGTWRQVLRSPMVRGRGGQRVPRDIGYRGITAAPASNGRPAALYVTTWAPSRGPAPIMLRSQDGKRFERVGRPEVLSERPVSYRAMVAFNGRLYTAPLGRPGGRPNVSGDAVVLESDDPAAGWRVAGPPGFGDSGNGAIVELAEFAGHLYAGTLNAVRGYEVWRTAAQGRPPYAWEKVLDEGAGRGRLNQAVLSMCVFGDALYVGSGIQGGGYDRTNRVGPAAGELVRVFPDGEWDLVAGKPRLTPGGVKFPLSGRGPGFDNPFAGYLWRMCAHDGHLYLGTYDWSVLLPFLPWERMPRAVRQRVRLIGIEELVERRAGFDLWRSANGERWTKVTGDGLGNPYNFGARTLASTPHGLFVGTANPFGPETAFWSAGGWRYAPNDAGGLETWLGMKETG